MNKKDKLKVLKTIEQGFDLAWKKKLKIILEKVNICLLWMH